MTTWLFFWQAIFDIAVLVYIFAPLFFATPKPWAGVDPSERPGFLNRTTWRERAANVLKRWRDKATRVVRVLAEPKQVVTLAKEMGV